MCFYFFDMHALHLQCFYCFFKINDVSHWIITFFQIFFFFFFLWFFPCYPLSAVWDWRYLDFLGILYQMYSTYHFKFWIIEVLSPNLTCFIARVTETAIYSSKLTISFGHFLLYFWSLISMFGQDKLKILD